MTAEVAILNRTAVALAADSAVTLQVRGQLKVYNGADKLFQLASNQPVGIMIFGGAEFVRIPLETLIKEYRRSRKEVPLHTIKAYAEDFFAYLQDEVKAPEEIVKDNVKDVFYSELISISQRSMDNYFSNGPISGTKRSFPQDIIHHSMILVRSRLEELERLEPCASLEGVEEERIASDYKDVMDGAIEQSLRWIASDDDKSLIRRLLVVLLLREFSPNATGFVFAGFGLDELFPKNAGYGD